jgi:hypothetical protein
MTTPDLSRVTWRKSRRSSGNGGECIEVAHLPGAVGVRDSKNPTGPALVFTAQRWSAFHTALKNGRFDVA